MYESKQSCDSCDDCDSTFMKIQDELPEIWVERSPKFESRWLTVVGVVGVVGVVWFFGGDMVQSLSRGGLHCSNCSNCSRCREDYSICFREAKFEWERLTVVGVTDVTDVTALCS